MTALSGLESAAIKQAADDLRRLSVMFRGILQIAPVLDQVVSLQQAADESEGRVTVAREQEAALKDSIAGLKAAWGALTDRISAASLRADGAEKEAADAVDGHIRSMLAKAAAKADGMTGDANRNASDVIERANVQAKDIMDRVNSDVAVRRDELAATSSALAAAKEELASALATFEELKAKLTRIT